MCLLFADIFPSNGGEKAKAQQVGIVGRDDDRIDILLMGDRWPPKPDDGLRHVFASRVFTDGGGEDVGRHTFGVRARTIKAGSQLDCPHCSLAPSGHIECAPATAEVARVRAATIGRIIHGSSRVCGQTVG
jgi:hypothetical protein